MNAWSMVRRVAAAIPKPKKENERRMPSAKFVEAAKAQLAECGLPYDHKTVILRARHLEDAGGRT